MSRYGEVYGAWKADPEAFWSKAAEAVDWTRRWDRVFDPDDGVYGRWFAGATCNTAWNCLDRHVAAGHGERTALVYDSPLTGAKARYSFAELTAKVEALAAALVDAGVKKGDRVIVYMPMIPEAVMAMLAVVRIGAIH
jgi:propionyl-CoA synthetase